MLLFPHELPIRREDEFLLRRVLDVKLILNFIVVGDALSLVN